MIAFQIPRILHRLSAGYWLLLALAVLPAHASRKEEYPGESAKWRRYQSPHFELFSANSDRDSREVLHNLELLRALFFENFKLKERQPLELTIYYFNDKDDFFKYVTSSMRGNDNLAGYHMSHPDRATIVLSPTWDDEAARHLVFHEYIHHLFRISGEDPPLWYNEGVAELYSSIEIGKDYLELGKPLLWHVASLRQTGLLPLETLFAVDRSSAIYNTGTHSGQFYAESWALLHYWYYGQSKLNRDKVAAFTHYISSEDARTNSELRRKIFRETMGMDYAAMSARLETYVRSGSYSWGKVPLPLIPPAKSYEWRPMSFAEVRVQLAELDLRANRSGKSRLALLREADQVPVKARIWEVLGADAWADGEADLAEERWRKALDAGTTNPAVYHELGLAESHRWFARFDYYYQMPVELADRLRDLLKHSIAFAPEQSDAYEMLAWIEGSVAKPDIANVNLVQEKFATLVNKRPTMVALALVRLHLNDQAGALEILKQVDASGPGDGLAAVIRLIRSHLKSAETPATGDGEEKPAPERADSPVFEIQP